MGWLAADGVPQHAALADGYTVAHWLARQAPEQLLRGFNVPAHFKQPDGYGDFLQVCTRVQTEQLLSPYISTLLPTCAQRIVLASRGSHAAGPSIRMRQVGHHDAADAGSSDRRLLGSELCPRKLSRAAGAAAPSPSGCSQITWGACAWTLRPWQMPCSKVLLMRACRHAHSLSHGSWKQAQYHHVHVPGTH